MALDLYTVESIDALAQLDPDSEFAHLVASFAERCRVDTLCLEYVMPYLRAAPLQQHMPSIMEPSESQESEFIVASQEELYAFQVYYRDTEKIMKTVTDLRRQHS